MENCLLYASNFSKICRVCLTECETLFSIYSEIFEENFSEVIPRIHEILNKISCIKVQPEDNLPKQICSKCINKAHSSYKFQLQCNRSQSLLDSYIEHLKKINKKINTEVSNEPTLSLALEQKNNELENVEIPITDKNCKTNSTCTLAERKLLPSMAQNFIEHKSNKKSVKIQKQDFPFLNKDKEININVDLNKTNFVDDFNDDFNSESDILSFTAEYILNTDDILKSLDLISNVDNEEELDEDEDCDDLKSCIPLGDETVDQLIKDNLQVDNLDLLTPKMESFNFSLVNKCNKSTLDILKHEEHLSDSIQLEIQSEKCLCHSKDVSFNDLHCKSKVQPALFINSNTCPQFMFENTANANELQKNNLTSSRKLFVSKLLKDSFQEPKLSIPLVVSTHQLQSDTILSNQLNAKENLSSISSEYQSSENVCNETKSASSNYNNIPHAFNISNAPYETKTISHPVQTSTQISNLDPKSFNKINDDVQNKPDPIKKLNPLGTQNKQEIDLQSKKLANEADTGKMSADLITHDVPNKLKLPNKNEMSEHNPVIQPLSEGFSLEHTTNVCKNEVIQVEKKCKEFIVSDKCETVLGMSKNTCTIEAKPKHPETNKQISSENNSDCETKIVSVNNSPKNYKKGSILLNQLSTNETNVEPICYQNTVSSISLKSKSMEHMLFKHPSVANIQSKYSSTKNYLTKCPTNTFLQINHSKPIQPTEPFRRIQTFSIKPREPPNMDYYKKEHGDKTVEYECNICPKKFRFAHSLRIHIKNHGLEKPFICTECKKDFKVYGSLVHHSRSHSGEQPFECQICGKRYKQSGTLTAHMRVHTGQKPFECKVCGKGFRQAPDLTYHMRTHTKEKPYMCTVCGKTMSMQCHLVQHMRSHTGEKPYKCSECDKAFPSSTRLKRHFIIHTALKPFKCKVCNKAYNRSSSLQVHMKVHSSYRSHSCSFCDRSFYWAHSLRAHVASHLKENDEKNVEDLPSCNTQFVKTDKEFLTEIKSESVINKTVSTDYFSLINTEELNELGLDSFQIITVGRANEDTKTFTLYSSESNNDHLSLLNKSIRLSAISL